MNWNRFHISSRGGRRLLTSAVALAAVSRLGCGNSGSGEIGVPGLIEGGDVQVSCSVACAEGGDCGQANVFVSACERDQPGLCYQIAPANTSGGGNTFVVSLDSAGRGDVIEATTCTVAGQGTEGLPVDLLFVIDTSSSMEAAIQGVLGSIDSFVDGLAESGVAARIGGIAFADTAPLRDCIAPDAPFHAFTGTFGEGTEDNPESFNNWISNVSASHCGDIGGDDLPENAIDAMEFALGNDPDPLDALRADAFDWNPESLHTIVVITDALQHQLSSQSGKAHFELSTLVQDLAGFAAVHVVGPNFGCFNTPAAGCACNQTEFECDEGCGCDAFCAAPGCTEDLDPYVCDGAATCDPDCLAYPAGTPSSCDLNVDICDPAADSFDEPCADDVDCAEGVNVGALVYRRCEPDITEPYADMGDLALATRGTFTTLPPTGEVDLTELALTGVLSSTAECRTALPEEAVAIRCVYTDQNDNQGEVVVELP